MSLVLDAVTIRVDGHRLFAPVDLEVAAGEAVALMAPSGAGKSSLLLGLVGGLHAPLRLEGRIRLDDERIEERPPETRRLGVLFQDPMLFPHMTVAQNLAFAVPRRLARAERRARVAWALDRAELRGFEMRRPSTLSGGQAARVALVRALLAEPRALLLDEPFAKLDVPLRRRVRGFVRDIVAESRLPCLLVTHDAADAEALGATVLELVPDQPASPAGQPTLRALASSRSASKIPG